jgi:LPXTG-motif cell wall-anchored protein
VQRYALLGFTNPGTGDYSTGTYGSTGWQVSTYQVSATGEYKLGFAVFNLDDNALSPVLLVDSEPGGTLKNDQQFGAVPPNNSNAPTVPSTTQATTTTEATTTTTEPETSTTTEPEVTTTVAETTTTVEETTTTTEPVTTTEAPRPIYIPSPVITEAPTTTIIETTTVVDNTIPSDTIPISELPKTGSDNQLFMVGAGLIIFGLFISYIRRWLYS